MFLIIGVQYFKECLINIDGISELIKIFDSYNSSISINELK